MGYTGGKTTSPTYHDIGDHAEGIQLDFDPSKLSYAALLQKVFETHDPTSSAGSGQYRVAVFVHDAAQRRVAEQVARARARGAQVRMPIEAAGTFTRAEDYHQKHDLQSSSELMRELRRYYPRFRDFVDSTAAARLNSYVAGQGSKAQLAADLERLGLSAAGKKRLLALRS